MESQSLSKAYQGISALLTFLEYGMPQSSGLFLFYTADLVSLVPSFNIGLLVHVFVCG